MQNKEGTALAVPSLFIYFNMINHLSFPDILYTTVE